MFGPDFFNRNVVRVARWQHRRGVIGETAHFLLKLRGTDIHPDAELPADIRLRHAAIGVVIHPETRFGSWVTIYQNVTIGRADIWRGVSGDFGGFYIGDGAILCAGSAVLNQGPETLVVAEGTVLGANAVLTRSTGPYEIWAGAPARKVGERPRPQSGGPPDAPDD